MALYQHRSIGRTWRISTALALSGILVGAGAGLAGAATTAPAGNEALGAYLITDPLPGVAPAATATTTALATSLQNAENSVMAPYGQTGTVAVQLWIDKPAKTIVEASLIAFNSKDGKAISAAEMSQSVSGGAGSFCAGSTGATPLVDEPISVITGARYVACPVSNGIQLAGIVMSKANILAFVAATTAQVTRAHLTALALEQHHKLPAAGFTPSSGTSTLVVVGAVIAAAVGLALLGVLIIWLSLRSRRAHEPPPSSLESLDEGPTRGWHLDTTNPTQERFWTGSGWGVTRAALAPPDGETSSAPPSP